MKKYPPSPKKATAQTVASNNIIAYGIFRFFELSCSHAFLLVNMGLGAKVIADRLGHKRIETTLNTYSHLYKSSQDSVITTLEDVNAKT